MCYLTAWGQKRIGNVKLQTAVANYVILCLDCAQKWRSLSAERLLRRTLKQLVLGFASLERMIMRQSSRIRWLSDGDANTKFFNLIANGSKTKKNDRDVLEC